MATVLVVEDHADTASAMTKFFGYAGYHAVNVGNGEDALEFLKWVLPAMVILDYSLPGICGGEVLEAMKADIRTKNVPVIVHTAHGQAEFRDEAMRLGAKAFCVKSLVGWDRLLLEVQACHARPPQAN